MCIYLSSISSFLQNKTGLAKFIGVIVYEDFLGAISGKVTGEYPKSLGSSVKINVIWPTRQTEYLLGETALRKNKEMFARAL